MEKEKNSANVGNSNFKFGPDQSACDLKAVAAPLITIEVSINPTVLVAKYVKAFVRKTRMENAYLAEQFPVYEDDLLRYIAFLIKTRIEIVNGTFAHPIYKLSSLWIPTFIWHALKNLGIVYIRKRGIKLIPKFDFSKGDVNSVGPVTGDQKTDTSNHTGEEEKDVPNVAPESTRIEPMTLDDALSFSEETLDMWATHVTMSQKAMPKDEAGDEQVMGCALIENKVRGLDEGVPSEKVYLGAFLEAQLIKETTFAVLYRAEYRDIEWFENVFSQSSLV